MGDLEKPLLAPKKVYPDCPGCQVALRTTAAGARPPYKYLLFVAVIVFCNSMPITSLFPYIYYMVRDFHIAAREEDIGFYAGFIGSAFMFGRFLTSFQWGRLADKFGRRPIMLTGLGSLVVFNTLFGLSTNFWMAVLSRLALGALNGSFTAVKAFASEVCTDRHQALSVSVVGTTWGLGLIVGPAIGGYLAQPAVQFPSWFPPGSFFDKFPYFLPALVTSAIGLVGFSITTQLPETLHIHIDELVAINGEHGKGEDKADGENETSVPKPAPPSKKALLKNWPLLVSVVLFAVWGFYEVAFSESFSFFALSPREIGGLGFTTVDVGNVLAVSGFGMLVWQLLVFPLIMNRFGPTNTIRVATLMAIPTLICYPLLSKLKWESLVWPTLVLAVWRNICSTTTMDGSFLFVNNSVKPSQRGAANGLAISMMALTTTLAPEAGGALFAWAQSRDSKFLPDDEVVFFVLGLVVLSVCILIWGPWWPLSLDKMKHEDDPE